VSAATTRREQQRIEQLLAQLDALPDPQARSCAQQLVQGVLDLHGIGLARLVDLLIDLAPAGPALLETLAEDEAVAALLLLHGLHPDPLPRRIERALDRLHAEMGVHGFTLELLAIDADADTVRLRLRGMPSHGMLAAAEVQHAVEDAVFALAPEVATVAIDGLAQLNMHELKFMPRRPASAGAASGR